jgi:ribosome biogenesis GTPase A
VLNKCDLISESERDYIVSYFAKEGIKVVTSVGTIAGGCKNIYNAFRELLSEKIERNKAKGVNKTLRAMVAGVPNTGKSTVINALSGKKAAMVGDKAGVTRGKQWIRLDGFELLDTPGTMPPQLDNNLYGLHLAYIGSLNDNLFDITDLEEIASHLYISKTYLISLFKKHLKISPKQYINEKRLLYAKNLLLLGNRPTDIYEKCGFSTYTSFFRSYKKYFGVAPSET